MTLNPKPTPSMGFSCLHLVLLLVLPPMTQIKRPTQWPTFSLKKP